MTLQAPLALLWARPGAAGALVLPFVLLVLVRVFRRPPEIVVGTLELWRELPEARAGSARRAHFPPWALLGALALLFGALAWLGPRAARAEAPRRWTMLVDGTPSMGLALEPGEPRTRLEAALAAAEAALSANLADGERVRWIRAGRAPLELAPGARPPGEWLAPAANESAPDWASHDEAGTLWLTDAAPALARARAGLFASGGAECPGAITIEDGASLWWEHGELARRPRAAPPRVRIIEPSGVALPTVLEGVLRAWCEARGIELAREPGNDELFVLVLAAGEELGDVRVGRDGWQATGRAVRLGDSVAEPHAPADVAAARGFEDWLAASPVTSDGTVSYVVVRVRPGRIELALRVLAEPAGDPAAFALSWARLFERAVAWPSDVVPLPERLAAGPAVAELGTLPAPESAAGPELGPWLDAGLALAAAACAACAWLASGAGASRPRATPAGAWYSRRT